MHLDEVYIHIHGVWRVWRESERREGERSLPDIIYCSLSVRPGPKVGPWTSAPLQDEVSSA